MRAVYLIAAAASVAAVLMVAGPAYATANWSCGETFSSSPAPLNNNLDCSGYSGDTLVITGDNVTLNFGGHEVDGATNYDVVDNDSGHSGLTVENGSIYVEHNAAGVDNDGGVGATVADVSIEGGGGGCSYGVDAYSGSDGLTVEGSSITGNTCAGVYVSGNGASITDNTISPLDLPADQGIEAYFGLGDVISGNTLTGSFNGSTYIGGEIGIHLHHDAAALVENNNVSDFGDLGYYESWSSGTQLTGNTFDGNYEGAEIGDYPALDGNASNDTISNNFFRNSYYEGMQDYGSDMNTYTGNVATNNGIECGNTDDSDCTGFTIYPDEDGSVTMTNNYSRLTNYGFWTYYAYNSDSYASTRSLISGNSATYDNYGFYDEYSLLSTFSNNTAYGNNYDGFYMTEPGHETITGNTSNHNGYDGFYFESNYAPNNPLAVTNNVATYNGDYGFEAEYPLSASSGNTGNNTNGTDDCWYISGCS